MLYLHCAFDYDVLNNVGTHVLSENGKLKIQIQVSQFIENGLTFDFMKR